MPDRVSVARPVTHRRSSRRPQIGRDLRHQVMSVFAAPLLCLVVLEGMTALASWIYGFYTVPLGIALGGSVFIAGLVGAVRAQVVAAALQQQRDAELHQIAEAARAAERTMIWTADQICAGGRPDLPPDPPRAGDDMLDKVLELIGVIQVQGAYTMQRVHDESQASVLVAMHRTLTRRMHLLIDEMLEHLTGLQKSTEDAELLDRSFKIDHLATRLRRIVESVSVVLGGQSLRETRAPVPVSTVLRGAKSEVVKYTRVQTAPGEVGAAFALPAHVHPDVAHVIAELIDNGLENSDPASKVIVRAQKVAKGLLIEVEDRASLLLDPDKRDLLNRLLDNPNQADVAGQVRAGSLGLITAGKLAAKYDLKVWLALNPAGGTTANVVVPDRYLVPAAPVVGTVTVSAAPQSRQVEYAGAAPQPMRLAPAAAEPARQQSDMSGAGSLPRRQRVARPMPDSHAAEPAGPARAARPQTVADWRSGLRAGLHGEPPSTAPNPHS
ncbi:ATP-binding protein [Streptomyces sp. V3I7]|uniref:ATP-binding protein n=1 Tax=Streptomyces sp. V3I7 TaxID=3042278 RepID=UPI0027862832|nr:ATP-binding protein [Streptomyces sp. V3I7]MDQ0990733.1 signal transduction histidine kinase [Streptomyces sp. V3I7]